MSEDGKKAGEALVVADEGAEYRTRQDGWTPQRRTDFLAALEKVGNVSDACRLVGISTTSAYRMRRRDRMFGMAWDAALHCSARTLEAVAYQRAVEGIEEPVFSGGKQVGTRRKVSDALLRLLVQGSNPEKYGRTGGQATVQAREELEARVEAIEKAAYDRAWRCFEAEYRFLLEPLYVRRGLLAMLSRMHGNMCSNAWCAECHPERQERAAAMIANGTWIETAPDPEHEPIPPFADWAGSAEDYLKLAEKNWIEAHAEEMERGKIAAHLAGRPYRYDETPGEPYQQFRAALRKEKGWPQQPVDWERLDAGRRERERASQVKVAALAVETADGPCEKPEDG